MKTYNDILRDAKAFIKDAGDNNTGKIVAAAVVGLAAGAVLGILLAPSSGKDTRNALADSLSDAGSSIKDKAKQGFDKLSQLGSQAVGTVKAKVQSTEVPGVTQTI